MTYKIETKSPYIIMGGNALSNHVEKVSEANFWQQMKEVLGEEKFNANEVEIRSHLSKPDSIIEFGDLIFSIT